MLDTDRRKMSDEHNHSSLSVPPSTQDHIQGVLDAAVVLVMYGDYQCFQSANVYRLIKAIQRQLSISFAEQDFCFIFRHFPQVQIHSHAHHAAEAAEAAAVQGQFWRMHETLLDHSQALGNGYLVEYANDLGLDMAQFLQELSQQVYVDRVNKDIESGRHSGVTAAPALFINGVRYTDHWNIEQLMQAIINANH